MTMPRKNVVIDGERGVYHCRSRCVRRAFLCGKDRYTGKNFEHRRGWLQERLKLLNSAFEIDLLSYAILSNHWHGVLRTRPDLAQLITDEEVAKRWMCVFPNRKSGSEDEMEDASERSIQAILADKDRVDLLRERLSSISWFMKSMNEYIARRGNREDEVTGRFWEGRFKCLHLIDDASILGCMTYVDLNPIRAQLADSLEDSEFTSAYDRIQRQINKKCTSKLPEHLQAIVDEQFKALSDKVKNAYDPTWLVDLDGDESPVNGLTERAYLNLLDVTGRCIKAGKKGVIPPEVRPLLESLDIDVESWVSNIERFGKLFYYVAGKAEDLAKAAKRAGMSWFKGKEGSRLLYKPKIPGAEDA
jgi:REP element-mobilizing transposase RayT